MAALALALTLTYGAVDTKPELRIQAAQAECHGAATTAMGYSFDDAPGLANSKDTLDVTVPVQAGTHVLHVKAWAPRGKVCVTDVHLSIP